MNTHKLGQWWLICFLAAAPGCLHGHKCAPVHDVPTETAMAPFPLYTIEPPDILLIDAVRVVPKPPYKIEALDGLLIQATEALPNEPINGVFGVGPDGRVQLGLSYGTVEVAGKTLDEARQIIEKQLRAVLKEPKVLVSLAQSRGLQQIRGQHLVRPDGTVGLGTYGSVFVGWMTLDEAKATIEAHLSQYLLNPEVSVDVFAYNSKFYYVITDGGGYGEQVFRIPATGNETVLDAIGNVAGLPAVASKKKIWVARPSRAHGEEKILPVCWNDIARGGSASSNYQIFPGDRIYVHSDGLIRLDTMLAKIISPIERVLGVSLLGGTTVNQFKTLGQTNGNGF